MTLPVIEQVKSLKNENSLNWTERVFKEVVCIGIMRGLGKVTVRYPKTVKFLPFINTNEHLFVSKIDRNFVRNNQ
jgi:hypothetical protein